jgi:endonuclease/exonuclease/phosphatase family metal-dependent hydrolase
MDWFESIQHTPRQKYSAEEFTQIKQTLRRKQQKLRIATYNMLFDLFDQNLAPENRWPQRLPRIVALLNDMNADVIGTQELQPNQVKDLLPLISNTYHFFSIHSSSGEQNGILFKKGRFRVLKKAIFPMVPMRNVVTMVQLKDRKTKKKLAILNVHFAFSKIEDRTSQAYFVAQKVRSIAKEMPVIFMGDLNTFPNWPDNIFPALDGEYVNHILTKKTLRDSINVAAAGHVGPTSTFTNNPPSIEPFQGLGTPGALLDHIYVSKNIAVLIHAVQPGTVDGHFPSDHMPVLVDCVVN